MAKIELSIEEAQLIHVALQESITSSKRLVRRELVKGKLTSEEIQALLSEIGQHEKIGMRLEQEFKIGS